MKLFVYGMEPLDCWDGWTLATDYKFAPSVYFPDLSCGHWLTKKEFDAVYSEAQILAKMEGWDGEVRDGPYISGIPAFPGDGCPQFLIGWKQDNNGTTFVASPIPLKWLEYDKDEENEGYPEDPADDYMDEDESKEYWERKK